MIVVTGVNEVMTSMAVAVVTVVSLVLSSEVDFTLVVDGSEDTGTLYVFSSVLALDATVDSGKMLVLKDALIDVGSDNNVVANSLFVGSLDCERSVVFGTGDSALMEVPVSALDDVGTAMDEVVVSVVVKTFDCSMVVASVVGVMAFETSAVISVIDCTEETGKLLLVT